MKKQKHLFEILLSSNDVFSRCISIIKPEYFDGEIKLATKFALEYFSKYNSIPDIDTINAEYDLNLKSQITPTDKIAYTCDEIEKFCKESAVALAMLESTNDLQAGNLGIIVERMKAAVDISLKRDLGWEIFSEDFLEKLEAALAQQETESTGIKALDKNLKGGLSRQQVTIFTANSGIGKSIMLNNLAYNYSAQGLNVVYLSLELPRTMVFARSSAIISGYDVDFLQDYKSEISSVITNVRSKTIGSLIIERINGNATTNDIRSYLTHYELEFKKTPDVLIVDYLDKMTPNQGVSKLSISEQDKFKSEQLAELVYDYNMICATASQQNREAIGNAAPEQDVIGGGLTKLNTVDNVISLYMDKQMRLRGEMLAFFLKTRNSGGVGKSIPLHYDAKTLRITDTGDSNNNNLFDLARRRKQLNGDLEYISGLEFENEKTTLNENGISLIQFMESL
jgi:KaiC/GvpD/RAD55 family RecA-like ATPase